MKTLLTTICCLAGAAAAQDVLSPCDIDLSANQSSAYITSATGRSVLELDLTTRTAKQIAVFPANLTGLAVSKTGNLYVTGGGPRGRIWSLNPAGTILQTLETGHTPGSPVLAPNEKTLYVCNRFDNDISFIDLATGHTTARVPVLREPVAADITPDGKLLFVANHNPDGPADVDYVASKISVIDTAAKTVSHINLVNGSEGVRGLKVSPDGSYVYATHFMARFFVPTTQLERGWVSTDALSVIRVSDQTLLYTILLDDIDQGFSNPWAIGFSEHAETLVVSSAGIHEVCLIDLPALTEKIEQEAAASAEPAHLNAHNNLSFLSGIRRRIKLTGSGPRALAVQGGTAYIANYFSDSIDCLDLESGRIEQTVELSPDLKITQERRGEMLFNDAGLCFQNWLSCATCHPDARTDALNWDLLNDGMGNPKNVKSMLLAHQTPRAMWLGVRADAETAVRAGITHIQFSVRPEEDALAIDAYLKSLTPVPSPFLVDGELSQAARRGKQLFATAGCIDCHPAPLFTDLETHDVGTPKGQDAGKPVDTPQLVEVWRTAPYLHDGRAATMREVITTFNHADTRGKTSHLTEEEITDLVEYLLSL